MMVEPKLLALSTNGRPSPGTVSDTQWASQDPHDGGNPATMRRGFLPSEGTNHWPAQQTLGSAAREPVIFMKKQQVSEEMMDLLMSGKNKALDSMRVIRAEDRLYERIKDHREMNERTQNVYENK